MSKLMKKDFKIVENFAGLALISLMIIFAGVIFMCAFGLNLGIDYEGGAKVEIELTKGVEAYETEFETSMTKLIEDAGYTVSDKMQKSPLSGGTGFTYEFRLNYELNGQNMGKNHLTVMIITLMTTVSKAKLKKPLDLSLMERV